MPLLENDSETGHEVIVSVLTQYRLLKFISINVRNIFPESIDVQKLNSKAYFYLNMLTQCSKEIAQLHLPLCKLKIGTYVTRPPADPFVEGQDPFDPIATASLETPVFDVVHMFSERGISAVPILDEEGIVVNLYETVDVIVSVILCHFVHQGYQ